MQDAITAGRCLARLAQLTDWNLLVSLWPVALRIARLVAGFHNDAVCPSAMLEFEGELKQLLDKIGRLIVQWRLNCLEPESRADLPPTLFCERDAYRLKRLSPMRNLNCLFGPIRVSRWLYESGIVVRSVHDADECRALNSRFSPWRDFAGRGVPI